MKQDSIINRIDTTNWKPIKTIRNFLPTGESPKLPFRTKAGGKEAHNKKDINLRLYLST